MKIFAGLATNATTEMQKKCKHINGLVHFLWKLWIILIFDHINAVLVFPFFVFFTLTLYVCI